MGRTFEEIMASLPKERRERIENNGKRLLAEVRSLREVRKIRGLTQKEIAKTLNKKQPTIHQMEQQTDFLISTFRKYVEAAGGNLEMTINFPDQNPIVFKSFSEFTG